MVTSTWCQMTEEDGKIGPAELLGSAACGGVVAQMEFDGGNEPLFAVYGAMLVERIVPRTMQRAGMWTLWVA